MPHAVFSLCFEPVNKDRKSIFMRRKWRNEALNGSLVTLFPGANVDARLVHAHAFREAISERDRNTFAGGPVLIQ